MKLSDIQKANKIVESLNHLKALKDAIEQKKGNKFAYLADYTKSSYNGWEIMDDELTKEISSFIIGFIKKKIKKLYIELDKL